MKPLEWDAALVDRLHAARRAELPANMQPVRQEWRDQRLMALLAHKATTAGVAGQGVMVRLPGSMPDPTGMVAGRR